jgi:hypothetical protein
LALGSGRIQRLEIEELEVGMALVSREALEAD